jgi:hypothetical protein
MQREGIRWACVLRESHVPRGLLGFGDHPRGCHRQRRHVQRLTDVASSLRTARVVMQRAARCEIQQHDAPGYGQRAPRVLVPENSSSQVHES